MSTFIPVVVRKDGRDDRVARTAVELVQFEHDGWSAVREASARVISAAVSPAVAQEKKAPQTDDKQPPASPPSP